MTKMMSLKDNDDADDKYDEVIKVFFFGPIKVRRQAHSGGSYHDDDRDDDDDDKDNNDNGSDDNDDEVINVWRQAHSGGPH